jgi:hypothetical protein
MLVTTERERETRLGRSPLPAKFVKRLTDESKVERLGAQQIGEVPAASLRIGWPRRPAILRHDESQAQGLGVEYHDQQESGQLC